MAGWHPPETLNANCDLTNLDVALSIPSRRSSRVHVFSLRLTSIDPSLNIFPAEAIRCSLSSPRRKLSLWNESLDSCSTFFKQRNTWSLKITQVYLSAFLNSELKCKPPHSISNCWVTYMELSTTNTGEYMVALRYLCVPLVHWSVLNIFTNFRQYSDCKDVRMIVLLAKTMRLSYKHRQSTNCITTGRHDL